MRFDRLRRLVGDEGLAQLNQSSVAVFGLGGVGSFAAEALVRSGIAKLIICDYDQVEESNINRQLLALDSTIGRQKTDIAKERYLDINPNLEIVTWPVKASKENLASILQSKPDYVVDAIDDVSAKIELIEYCSHHQIPLISSMGFANKMHPEMIEIERLQKTSVCPLAKTMRKKLKERGLSLDLLVVYSKETPMKQSDNVLGSSAFVPSAAGLMMAAAVVNQLQGGNQ